MLATNDGFEGLAELCFHCVERRGVQKRAALVADWERLGFEAGQVRILEEDYLLKPGPRAPQAAARLAEAICGD